MFSTSLNFPYSQDSDRVCALLLKSGAVDVFCSVTDENDWVLSDQISEVGSHVINPGKQDVRIVPTAGGTEYALDRREQPVEGA